MRDASPLTRPAPDPPDVMTERETAAYMRISARTVFSLAKEGRLPCIRIGQRKLFRRSTVETFLAELESTGASAAH